MMRATPVTGAMSWQADTLLPQDGKIVLTADCRAELRDLAAELEANPLPVEALAADDYAMPHCRALMATVKQTLDTGLGFAIIDHLPLDDMDPLTATKLHWLLVSMTGRIVAQKWDGAMVYDVTDTGKKPKAGNGVRASKSNEGQGYHTDNSFGMPPDYVALLCLHPAQSGGISGLISFDTVHNRLLEMAPDLLARLYQPFRTDRQREHAPDDDPVAEQTIFEFDGEILRVTLASDLNRQGYAMAGEDMDGAGIAALAALDALLEEPDLGKVFTFERGQIQIVNNRRLGHRRTAYTDSPDPALKRHLIRLWVRHLGGACYHG